MTVAGTASLAVDSLRSHELEVEVLPTAGARLHRLRAFGRDVLRTPDDPATHLRDPFYWGAYHMVPWANRVAPVPTHLGRRVLDLRANFKDGTAIHGLHCATAWETSGPGTYAFSGGGDGTGWPWPYSGRVEMTVDAATLRVAYAISNHADEPMPAGAGIHPWFVGPVEVRVPASEAIASNVDSAAPHEPAVGDLDMRTFRALVGGVDAAWPVQGDPAFELRWPSLGVEAAVRAEPEPVYVVAANPDVGAVAVEPQSHAPWGLRRLLDGERGALAWVEPVATFTFATEMTFTRTREERR